MTARARRPTDEVATKVFDEEGRRRTRFDATSTTAGSGTPQVLPVPPAPFESFELDATEVTPLPGRAQVEQATPTHLDPGLPALGVPVALARGAQRSEQIRVISMKERAEVQHPRNAEQRVPLHVQLRSMAEVAGVRDTPPGGLGNLAPPRDPREARARHRRDDAIWACIALALAGAIMLAVWFVARR
jgi:hypothetical protein